MVPLAVAYRWSASGLNTLPTMFHFTYVSATYQFSLEGVTRLSSLDRRSERLVTYQPLGSSDVADSCSVIP